MKILSTGNSRIRYSGIIQIIDGKKIANQIKSEIAAEVAQLREQDGRSPHLAAILVGNNPASETYVKNKEFFCDLTAV